MVVALVAANSRTWRKAAPRESWDLTPAHASLPPLSVALDEGTEVASTEAAALPQMFAAEDARFRLIGRFLAKGTRRHCAWGGSTFEVMVEAPALNLLVDDGAALASAPNYLQIVVDETDRHVLRLRPGHHAYRIVLPPALRPHLVTVVKRTEVDVGSLTIEGIELPADGRLAELPVRPHTLLALGDSITAGFGLSSTESSVRSENAYLTYGAIAARAMNANYIPLGFSGKGVHENLDPSDTTTYPQLFTRAFPTDATSPSVPEIPVPDAILVNLGTNDSLRRKLRVPRAPFVTSYRDFLEAVRARWPAAPIFCTLGPMVENRTYEARLDHAREYIKEAVAARRSDGDEKVYYFDLAPQDEHAGVGASHHPNVATHARMAREVLAALGPTLNW